MAAHGTPAKLLPANHLVTPPALQIATGMFVSPGVILKVTPGEAIGLRMHIINVVSLGELQEAVGSHHS